MLLEGVLTLLRSPREILSGYTRHSQQNLADRDKTVQMCACQIELGYSIFQSHAVCGSTLSGAMPRSSMVFRLVPGSRWKVPEFESGSGLPSLRVPASVENGDHLDDIDGKAVVDNVRETLQVQATNRAVFRWDKFRRSSDPIKHLIQSQQKLGSQSFSLIFVPVASVRHVLLSF